jgi:hypothetical protein
MGSAKSSFSRVPGNKVRFLLWPSSFFFVGHVAAHVFELSETSVEVILPFAMVFFVLFEGHDGSI